MGDMRPYIERRIIDFEILSLEHPTPLLREQIRHAVALHRKALKQPDVDPYLKDLDDLQHQFEEHWTKIYGDAISRATLLQDIIMFQRFLIAKLLEDYMNEPCPVNKWVLDQVKCIVEQEDYTGANDGSNMDTTHQVHVVYPLEEMMLDRDHVENKLRAAAMGQEHSGSDIQRLIDKCDWSNLATALAYDRGLALKLFEGQPPDANIFDAKTYERILQGIDQIQGKYFMELLDSSTFTISTHAREMSAGQASSQFNIGSAPLTIRPSNSRPHSEDPSRNGWAWGIYGRIVSGLKGTKPTYSTSSDANCDEATSLVNSKKAR